MIISEAFQNVSQVFWDTAPVIYHVEGHKQFQPVTDWIFSRVTAGEISAVASSNCRGDLRWM